MAKRDGLALVFILLGHCAARPEPSQTGVLGASADAGGGRDVTSAADVVTPVDAPATPRDDGPDDVALPSPDVVAAQDAGCVYEPVTPDAMGNPRNAAGLIRHCWPGEALCTCDRDNDCYAEAGYTPSCRPGSVDAGVRPDVVAAQDVPVTVVDVPRPQDAGPPPAGDTVSYTGSFPTGSGRRTVTLRVAGLSREVVVYVPASRGSAPPLMLLFHGTNGTGAGILDESDAQRVADANGAIVVAPNSRYMSRGDWDHMTEETYWETYPNGDPNANPDLVLVRACIAEARARYNVDPARVYALGHSNGGMFATLVATVLAYRIAAFATSSAGINRCATTWSCSFQGSGSTCAALRARPGWCNCTGASKPIAARADGRMPPGYLAHGTRDPMVSVQHTCEQEAQMLAAGAAVQTALRDGDGHVLPSDFVTAAWRFIGSRRR